LLAENLEKAAGKRTVAAITERNQSDANADAEQAEAESRPAQTIQIQSAVRVVASAEAEPVAPPQVRPNARPSVLAAAAAAVPQKTDPTKTDPAKNDPIKTDPPPLTNGVVQAQSLGAIPGSSEPMRPVRVKTVQVKAGPLKLAAAGPPQPVASTTSAIPAALPGPPETSGAIAAKAETNTVEAAKMDVARNEMPPQPANHGTGNGLLGVLPASSLPPSSTSHALAYADPTSRSQSQAIPQNGAIKPVASHTGWIVQVGALETESEAQQRIEAARNQARGLLAKADPFTEPVLAKGDKKLYRARFAGLDRDQAEAVCRALKRSDFSCITIRN
jgi:D-alanyl-D-alanine carboxypeptidase